jgi:hypothetical protein
MPSSNAMPSATSPTKEFKPSIGQMTVDIGLATIPDMNGMRANLLAALKAGGKTQLQGTKLDLVLFVVIGKATPLDPATIYASLENTQISSGDMFVDKDDQRGYYQDKITVQLLINEPDGSQSTRFTRVSDGPETANGTSSTSSSVSFSFSGSANVGFFGPTPTAGAGVSVGSSVSHSFARNLTDFRVANNSDNHTVSHDYIMSASSGGAYAKATDLVPSDLDFVSAFQGIKLYEPPPLALNNLNIISQAAWQADNNDDIAETLTLKIIVTQQCSMVDGTNNFFTVLKHSSGQIVTYSYSLALPMNLVSQSTDSVTV